MPRPAARFTKADVTRALKGAEAAGVNARVLINRDGDILIEPVDSPPTVPKDEIGSGWDWGDAEDDPHEVSS